MKKIQRLLQVAIPVEVFLYKTLIPKLLLTDRPAPCMVARCNQCEGACLWMSEKQKTVVKCI